MKGFFDDGLNLGMGVLNNFLFSNLKSICCFFDGQENVFVIVIYIPYCQDGWFLW